MSVIIAVLVLLLVPGTAAAVPIACVCDADGSGQVTVAEVIRGVTGLLEGCVTPVPPTPTRTIGPTITPTPAPPRCGEAQTVFVRADRAATCLGVHGQLQWIPGELQVVSAEALQVGCLVWSKSADGTLDWMMLCSLPVGEENAYPYALTVVPTESTTITSRIVEAVTPDPPRPCGATAEPIQITCRP